MNNSRSCQRLLQKYLGQPEIWFESVTPRYWWDALTKRTMKPLTLKSKLCIHLFS